MQPRTLRIALAISMIVNLFALGAFGGAAWMWTHREGVHPRRGRPVMTAADTLPDPDQQRFRATMHAVLGAARPLQQSARENRTAAAADFVRPSFDADAVTADLARARQADFALRVRLEDAVVAFAKDLPVAERASLAQGLARSGPLRHPHPSQQGQGPTTPPPS